MRSRLFFAGLIATAFVISGCSSYEVAGQPASSGESAPESSAQPSPERSVLDPALQTGMVTTTDPSVIDNRRISCVDGNLTQELTIIIGYNGEGEIGVAIGDFEDEKRFFYKRVDTRDQPGEPFYKLTTEIQNLGKDVDVVVSTVGAGSQQIGQVYFGELNAETCLQGG